MAEARVCVPVWPKSELFAAGCPGAGRQCEPEGFPPRPQLRLRGLLYAFPRNSESEVLNSWTSEAKTLQRHAGHRQSAIPR